MAKATLLSVTALLGLSSSADTVKLAATTCGKLLVGGTVAKRNPTLRVGAGSSTGLGGGSQGLAGTLTVADLEGGNGGGGGAYQNISTAMC